VILKGLRAGSNPALLKQVSAAPSECRPRLGSITRLRYT
jgi:hypothetical protein